MRHATRRTTVTGRPVAVALAVTLGLGAGLGLAACTGTKAAPAPTATTAAPAPTPTPTQTPTPEAAPVWPLTGVETSKVADRPALGVKIENSTDARPQTGLEDADMVWEEVVEGGITRFLAVYQSKTPTKIGPIRSVRPMDPAVFAPTHGVLAFSGGQRPFVQRVRDAGIQVLSMDAGSKGFYRTHDRYAPHNVYASTKDFFAQADSSRTSPPKEELQFATGGEKPTTATSDRASAAKTVAIRMSPAYQPGWTWDAESRTYLRSERGVPSVSTAGVRLSATNVVVLRVKVETTRYRDPAGNPVPETILTGSGKGTVVTGGKAVPVTWSKGEARDPLKLTLGGKDVQLAPGQTWVELVPVSTGAVTIS